MSRSRGRRRLFRRCRTLPGALGITGLSALVPGSGYLYSRRSGPGLLVLLASLAIAVTGAVVLPHDLRSALDLAFDPDRLKVVAWIALALLIAWASVVVSTFLMVCPMRGSRWKVHAGAAFVGLLCFSVAVPATMVARNAFAQADLIESVFENNQTHTAPTDVSEKNPWGGRSRINVLLLGGDSGPGRDGTRTDSMILVSTDTTTGKTVTFGFPRNMMLARFPTDSPLHEAYPKGFTGLGEDGSWMLNAVYKQVPVLHPGILGKSQNEGADAIKQAIEGSSGLPVDYYILVDLAGFKTIIDAMGGVTVNINEPVAVGGIPPDDYLEPGPDQHLNGFEALWFSRGRYGSDDYQRMERQRCMVNAIIEEADPFTLLRRYEELAGAGKEFLQTDIPRELLSAFVELAIKAQDHRVKSVVFRSSEDFFPGDPDFDYIQSTVARSLEGGGRKHRDPDGVDKNQDVCAYQPAS